MKDEDEIEKQGY